MVPVGDQQREQVIRIPFGWLMVGVVIVVLLGVLGGVVAQHLWPVRQAPLILEQGRLTSTVQEVTISPSTAAAQIVEGAHRSVVALAAADEDSPILAAGVLLTNDGVVVTAADVPRDSTLLAFDFRGVAVQLDHIGVDGLYGLGWWKVRDGVFVPLELRDSDPVVGSELLAVVRAPETLQPRVASYRLNYYGLPPDTAPAGWQKVGVGSLLAADDTFRGSPLLDEEGKLAALVMQPTGGVVLPASYVRESLGRLTGNQREFDPLEEVGLSAHYGFTSAPNAGEREFSVEISAVVPGSIAGAAGLQRGDRIVAVGEDAVDWDKSFVQQVAGILPLQLTVLRANHERTFTLQPLSTVAPQ